MIPIGPKETTRMVFRLALFRRRGMSEDKANALADDLAKRDWLRDDRRSCAECANYQRGGTCFATQQGWIKHHPLPASMLHRCEEFDWSKPS